MGDGIIIMEICKAPTLWLKALNRHTHMYNEMENAIPHHKKWYRKGITHNYAKYAHTHKLYRLIGVKDNVA